MNPASKRFSVLLLLVTLVHAALLLGMQRLPLTSSPQKQQPVLPVVFLVSQSILPETRLQNPRLQNPNTLTETKQNAEYGATPEIERPPSEVFFQSPVDGQNADQAPPKPVAIPNIAPKRVSEKRQRETVTVPTIKPMNTHAPPALAKNSEMQPEHQPQSPATQEAFQDWMPSMETVSRWDRQRRSSATQNEETVGLNTSKIRYASYLSQLKQRLEQGWTYPSQAKKDKLSGSIDLVFTIRQDGQLVDVQVLRSSGSVLLDESAVHAVQNAVPFAPLPKDWSLAKLHVHTTFEYIRRGSIWRD